MREKISREITASVNSTWKRDAHKSPSSWKKDCNFVHKTNEVIAIFLCFQITSAKCQLRRWYSNSKILPPSSLYAQLKTIYKSSMSILFPKCQSILFSSLLSDRQMIGIYVLSLSNNISLVLTRVANLYRKDFISRLARVFKLCNIFLLVRFRCNRIHRQ